MPIEEFASPAIPVPNDEPPSPAVRKRGRLVRNRAIDFKVDSPELSDAPDSPVNPVPNEETPSPAAPLPIEAYFTPVNPAPIEEPSSPAALMPIEEFASPAIPVPNDEPPSPATPEPIWSCFPPDDHVASIMPSDGTRASYGGQRVIDIDYIDVRVLLDRFGLLLGTDFINLSNPMLKKVCKLYLLTLFITLFLLLTQLITVSVL